MNQMIDARGDNVVVYTTNTRYVSIAYRAERGTRWSARPGSRPGTGRFGATGAEERSD